MSKKNMKKKKWKKVFGAWLAIVIVLVAILAVLVYKMLIERFISHSTTINLEARECFIRLRFQTEV